MTEQDQPEDEAVASTASNDAVDQDGIVLAEQLIAAEPVDLDETPNREAAKYRVRVRALETENVALAAQIEVLQRAQVGAPGHRRRNESRRRLEDKRIVFHAR